MSGRLAERLAGKVAVVTAAASGIGRASALRLAAEGALLVVNDLDAAALAALVAEIRGSGGTAEACPGDVREPATHAALVARAEQRFGRLDVLHNNAGVGIPGPLHEVSDTDWRRQLAVTLDSAFYGTRAALRVMRAQRAGSIINTASGAALAAEENLGVYSTAKSALVGLTRATAVENAALGIRANAICPGTILTPAVAQLDASLPGGLSDYAAAHPQRRLGTAEEVAALVAFLASDDSAHISGAAIPIDGGISARRAVPPLFPR
jgi:meso-butanediol dehydrogenase/(S,S)-butanediol dehydrogenase/diacetyl reductase